MKNMSTTSGTCYRVVIWSDDLKKFIFKHSGISHNIFQFN